MARRAVIHANRPEIFDPAFPQQKAFARDPAKLKSLFCTRRSAKSYTAGLYLVYEAMTNPGCNCLFVGLTRDSAKGIVWKDILSEINFKFGLGMVPNQTDLTMTLPNGSVIKVTGVDADEQEMKKLLGRKYRLVCIDEASMYTVDVRNLVYGVLKPAMVDPNAGGERGTICLMGTASNFPRGLFYDITTGKESGWTRHEWTAHDNPYVAKQWQEELEEIARDRPLYMETPQFKQWYLNQWVIDEEKLVYRFNTLRNLAKELPKLPSDGWTYTLGVDLGWEDDNAFVLSAYHLNDPNLYIIDSCSKKKLTFDQVSDRILAYQNDRQYPPHKIVIDGANKQGVESMRARSSIPFEYADKQDKATFIELFNSDLVQGKVKVLDTPRNRPLWEEMLSLVWMTDGDKIRLPKKEHPNLPNHRCFVAGTMIRTPSGERSIESLEPGDLVCTRKGPRPIENCITSIDDVVDIRLSNGASIVCTKDHPFWTKSGWVPAKYLIWRDHLEPWSLRHRARNAFFGMVMSGGGTKAGTTRVKTQNSSLSVDTSTESYGHRTMARYRHAITSTIKMVISPITGFLTSSACLEGSTGTFIQTQGTRTFSTNTDISQPPGTSQKKAAPGTQSTPGKPSRSSPRNARGAALPTRSPIRTRTKPDAAQGDASPPKGGHLVSITKNALALIAGSFSRLIGSTRRSHAHLHVRSVTAMPGKETVYNLTVSGVHEYFAAGVLVSNCDALLYNWRCGFHYHSEPAKPKIVTGSKAWYEKQAEDIWENERERLVNDGQKPLWPEENGW